MFRRSHEIARRLAIEVYEREQRESQDEYGTKRPAAPASSSGQAGKKNARCGFKNAPRPIPAPLASGQ